MEQTFSGAEWKAYSTFELKWLELVLTHGALTENDIDSLSRKFNVQFKSTGGKSNTSPEQAGNTLLNDIPREELLPAVRELVAQHAELPTFEEAMKIHDLLSSLPIGMLAKMYRALGRNTKLANAVWDDCEEGTDMFTTSAVVMFILGAIYQSSSY